MNATIRQDVYVTAGYHEWLEVAAHLPRDSPVRMICMDRSRIKGQTWASFSMDEWPTAKHAALAAGVLKNDEGSSAPPAPTDDDRSRAAPDIESLAMLVRETWVDYCRETGDTKPSHLAPWEELSAWDQEADRRIARALADRLLGNDRAALARCDRIVSGVVRAVPREGEMSVAEALGLILDGGGR